MRIKALQRTSNSPVELTLRAIWRHTWLPGSASSALLLAAERRSVSQRGPRMQEYDLFLGLAEVAIVFAGFSGISVILGRRGPGGWSGLDAGRVGMLVENSLVFALFALLPLALWGLGLRGPTVWVICSSGLALYFASTLVRTVPRMYRYYRAEPDQRDHTIWIVATFGSVSAAIVVQCLNVLSLGFERTSGPFLSGVIVGLAIAARLFVRSLHVLRSVQFKPPD